MTAIALVDHSTAGLIIAAAAPVFFALMLLEARMARRRGRQVFEGRDTRANLLMGVGNRVIETVWVGVEVAILAWVHDRAPFDLGSSPLAWVGGFLAVDLAYYWYHRSHHEVRALWAVHVVHHSSRRYNLAVALRQPWIVPSLTPFFVPLAFLGVPVEVLAVSYAVNLLYQFWIHTELIDRLPAWFEATMNTPSHHRVHHGRNPEYLDRNYGGVLIVWDRLFGTFEPERAPVQFGLTKDISTYNPFRIAFAEPVAIARAVRRAHGWRDRARHLVKGPGWAPAADAPAAPAFAGGTSR